MGDLIHIELRLLRGRNLVGPAGLVKANRKMVPNGYVELGFCKA